MTNIGHLAALEARLLSTDSIVVNKDYSDASNHILEDEMDASDELAAIEARLTEDENEYAGGVVDQNVRDRRYLLAVVREQAAKLNVIAAFADEAENAATQYGRNQGCVGVSRLRAALEDVNDRPNNG